MSLVTHRRRQTSSTPNRTCAVLMWEGRIDNRAELSRSYRTGPGVDMGDRELVRAVYERCGVPGLRQVIGDWSLVLDDPARECVTLARDYAGVRPLYYHAGRDGVRWSSNFDSLVDDLRLTEIDERYIAGYLACGGHPGRTPFRGVHSVPAGEAVVVSARSVTTEPFWYETAAARIAYSDEQIYDEQLRELFREAVATRLVEPRPVVAELSGGLDSSSVVCMASALIRAGAVAATGLTTISYVFPGSLDEPFIDAVEAACHVTPVRLSTRDTPLFSERSRTSIAPNEAGPLQLSAAAVAQQCGAGAFLTGQGGDLMFGNWMEDTDQVGGLLRLRQFGQAWNEAVAWSRAGRVPVAHILLRAVASAIPFFRVPAAGDSASATGDRARRRLMTRALIDRAGFTDPDDLFSPSWRSAPVERRQHVRALTIARQLGSLQAPPALHGSGYSHPMFHRPLVEFLLSVPAHVLCRPGQPRLLMRRAFGALWPSALRSRKSKGLFSVPYFEAFGPFAAKLLAERTWRVVEQGWIDRAALRTGLERLAFGLPCHVQPLRQALLLESWLRQRSAAAA